MIIHPLIKELQLRANRLAKEYEIEDCVMAVFNAKLGQKNQDIFRNKSFIQELHVKGMKQMNNNDFVDFIYRKYNQFFKLF